MGKPNMFEGVCGVALVRILCRRAFLPFNHPWGGHGKSKSHAGPKGSQIELITYIDSIKGCSVPSGEAHILNLTGIV